MRLLPSGTRAVLIELDGTAQVRSWHRLIREDPPTGLLDVVPAARTVLVVMQEEAQLPAAREHLGLLSDQLGQHEGAAGTSGAPAQDESHQQARERVLRIPVIYDGEDLQVAAEAHGIEIAELIRRHTEEVWQVDFAGFAPGFGYCSGQDFQWQTPRRSEPRTKVPAGSVALAGQFTAVYPKASPGGWQLIGRTETTMFDVDREPPALLRAGVRVRFEEARNGPLGARRSDEAHGGSPGGAP